MSEGARPKPKTHEYDTTFPWAACTLFLAAVLTATLFVAYDVLNLYNVAKPAVFRQRWLDRALITFLINIVFWMIGLFIFGAPVWRVLHISGRRQWYHAMLAGFAVPFTVILAFGTGFFTGQAHGQWSYFGEGGQQWVDGSITRFGLFIAFRNASINGLIGAFVAFFIWKVAYRRRQTPSATSGQQVQP